MRRREGYYFPCTICPYQKVKLGRMSVKTMPHTIGVWMPVKIQFFFLKQIYKLSIFWCIWKFKSLTYSNCVPSGFPGLLQSIRDLWTKLSGLANSWEGAALQPPWTGGHCETSFSRVSPMTKGTTMGQRRDCAAFFTFFLPSSLSNTLVFYFRKDNCGSLITLSRIAWKKSESVSHWTQDT